jgi:hypothetical protein
MAKEHGELTMADEKEFAKELNELIKRYIDGGCDPKDIADELLREANYVFGHYNLEIYLEAKPITRGLGR